MRRPIRCSTDVMRDRDSLNQGKGTGDKEAEKVKRYSGGKNQQVLVTDWIWFCCQLPVLT